MTLPLAGVMTPRYSGVMTKEIESLPKCPGCEATLELRSDARMTPEQQWCGVWYDHPPMGLRCTATTSVLYPSKELREQHSRVALVG